MLSDFLHCSETLLRGLLFSPEVILAILPVPTGWGYGYLLPTHLATRDAWRVSLNALPTTFSWRLLHRGPGWPREAYLTLPGDATHSHVATLTQMPLRHVTANLEP